MATIKCKILGMTDKANVSKTDKPFLKMEIVAQSFTEVNGNDYEENWAFVAQNEKCNLFDNVNVGDEVTIKYTRRGNIYTKKDDVAKTAKNPKHIGCISSMEVVDCVKEAGSTILTKKTKPAVIPEGYVWDDVLGMVEMPF